MEDIQRLKEDYPWIQTPLVVGAPMRLIALADMAVEVSKAGGIGFIGAGTDITSLPSHLQHAQALLRNSPLSLPAKHSILPLGIGFINWGASLPASISIIAEYRPAAVWFFAPSSLSSLVEWTLKTREASPGTKIWVQVGSVKEALEMVRDVGPDVLVVQGTDAGGHGLVRGAGIITLVPERPIIIAAGGISDRRSASASFLLGASGVVLGTRLLATPQARISAGYQKEILRVSDGGQTTVRTKVYDSLRGTNWAESHNARGLINKSFEDAEKGMGEEENKRLYDEETKKGDEGWGVRGRMTTYAGSGVGLVRGVMEAGDVVRDVREGVRGMLGGAGGGRAKM